jgi:hypothetical protein
MVVEELPSCFRCQGPLVGQALAAKGRTAVRIACPACRMESPYAGSFEQALRLWRGLADEIE